MIVRFAFDCVSGPTVERKDPSVASQNVEPVIGELDALVIAFSAELPDVHDIARRRIDNEQLAVLVLYGTDHSVFQERQAGNLLEVGV